MPARHTDSNVARRANLALFAGAFATFAMLYSAQPVLAAISRSFALGATAASLVLSVSTGALALCLPLTGALSESLGRKRLMGVSLLVSAVFALLTAVSPGFFSLLVLRALLGATLAGLPAIAMAYVAGEFEPRRLGTVMGLYISGTTVGGMAGRIISGSLADWLSWRVGLGSIGVIGLLAAAALLTWLPRERHFQPQPFDLRALIAGFVEHLRQPALVGLFVCAFLLMGSFVTLYNYIGFLLLAPRYGLSQAAIGWIFILYVTGTFSSAWMGRLADRFGRSVVFPSAVCLMLGGALITLVPSLIVKIVALALLTFGFFGAHAVASGWVSHLATRHRAQASSLYLIFYYLGSSIAGTLGGLFWEAAAWPGVIGLVTAMLASCLLVSLYLGNAS